MYIKHLQTERRREAECIDKLLQELQAVSSHLIDVICLTTSAGECRSMSLLWILRRHTHLFRTLSSRSTKRSCESLGARHEASLQTRGPYCIQ